MDPLIEIAKVVTELGSFPVVALAGARHRVVDG